nr:hypothetical protein CFP56_35594 [Quercus suber]
MFVPGSGSDFGGEDTPRRIGRETEGRSQGAVPPQEAVTNIVDLESPKDNQVSENPDTTANFKQTSHAGKVLDCPESLPIVQPANAHTDMVNFEAQIQDIDMELNKFDNHTSCTTNPSIMDKLPPSLSIYSDQVHARDKSILSSHNSAHESINEPRDLEGDQKHLRTWKRLARSKQTSEENMHAPTLGKRPIVMEGEMEAEQTRKKIQISNGDQYLLAEAAEQSRQYQ